MWQTSLKKHHYASPPLLFVEIISADFSNFIGGKYNGLKRNSQFRSLVPHSKNKSS